MADGSVRARKVLGVGELGDITYTRLCQSWLFVHVQKQFDDGNIDPQYIKKVQKAIFNISMRANSC